MSSEAFKIDFIEFSKKQYIFSFLSESEMFELSQYLKLLSFQEGEIIFNKNERSYDLYIIVNGTVELWIEDKDKDKENEQKEGKNRMVIGALGKGEIFGEISFIDDSPRACTIQAISPLILVKLPRLELENGPSHIREIYIKLLKHMTKLITSRLRNSNEQFLASKQLATNSLKTYRSYLYLLLAMLLLTQLSGGVLATFYLTSSVTSSTYFKLNLATTALLIAVSHIFGINKTGGFLLSKFKQDLLFPRTLILSISIFIGGGVIFFIGQSFKPFSLYGNLSLLDLLLYPLYCFGLEYLFRGFIQSTISEWKGAKTLYWGPCYTALLITCSNFYFGPMTAILTVLINIACGLLYAKEKNLFLSTLAHVVLLVMIKCFGGLSFCNFT